MNQTRRQQPSDLTDQQWEIIRKMIPRARSGGRPRSTSTRDVVNAILYMIRSGCAWRYLPKDYPPWPTVYAYFSLFARDKVWEKIETCLHTLERERSGQCNYPSYVIIDSQSVKAQYGEDRGYDGFKKIRGRKRHFIVDSLGFPLAVKVSSATSSDALEGLAVLTRAKNNMKFNRLEEILVDGGYRTARFFEGVITSFNILPTIRNSTTLKGRAKREGRKLLSSSLRPRRWIVERSFAWLINFRRLNRDYERKVLHSESMIYIAITALLLNRLAPG